MFHLLIALVLVAVIATVAGLNVERIPWTGFSDRFTLVWRNCASDAGVVSLAQAKLNATDDIDVQVIDEFRKESAILDAMQFDDVVSGAGNGATLTYGYTRLITQPTAAFRAINSEYTPQEVTKARFTVDLKPLGGAFQIDRVLAGVAAGAEVTLQMDQKIKATRTKFQDEVINGDIAVNADGFDGLNKALANTDTEMNAGSITDWTAIAAGNDTAFVALDLLDEFLAMLNGPPTMILGNRWGLAKVRGLARRAGMHVRNPIEDLLGNDGRPIVRESYGNVLFVDPGERPGTNDPIIPLYDPDNAVYTLTVSGVPTGGTFSLLVTRNGVTRETAAIAFNANAAAIDAAIEALDNIGAAGVAVTGTGPFTATFSGAMARQDIVVALGDNNLTGGTAPTVAVAETGGTGGLTDLYAVRFGLDGFHGVAMAGQQIIRKWMPDFERAGAVKTGEVEMGPAAVALKATKAAAVLRNLRVR